MTFSPVTYDPRIVILPNLSSFVGHSPLLDKSPEDCVVQVVDVTVGLPPRQVIPHVSHSWIEDGTTVEGRWMF